MIIAMPGSSCFGMSFTESMPSLSRVSFGLSLTLLDLSLSATHIELSGLSKIKTIDNVHAAHCLSCVSPPIQTYHLSHQSVEVVGLAKTPLTH